MPNNEQAGNTIPIPTYPNGVNVSSLPSFTPFHQLGGTVGVLLKTGAGVLHTVVCNTPSVTATLTVFNGTNNSGTIVASLGGNASLIPFTALFDVAFTVGLFVVVVDSSGASDWTVTYK